MDTNVLVSALLTPRGTAAKVNGYKPFSNRTFTMDVHRRYEIRRTGTCSSVIIGLALKK
jgi:hypothetical protein